MNIGMPSVRSSVYSGFQWPPPARINIHSEMRVLNSLFQFTVPSRSVEVL
jgi:hypothetical protein